MVCWNMGQASRLRRSRSPELACQSPEAGHHPGCGGHTPGVGRAPNSRGAAARTLLAGGQAQLRLGREHALADREAHEEPDRARLRQPQLHARATPQLGLAERAVDDLRLAAVALDLAGARLERAAAAAA